jgi:hypothetical protein
MTDLVALIIGISRYPKLAETWNIRGDRTANDAIAVTKALVEQRQVDPDKIRLLLSTGAPMPADVAGVVPQLARKENLEAFISQELGEAPFVGDQFLFFCSGHGVAAEKQQETLIVSSDSFVRQNKNMFICLAVEELRAQLQGMPQFADQIFCINSCRTPQEWAVTGGDEVNRVMTVQLDRPEQPVTQARFFSARELYPAPVEDRNDGYSNGFGKAVVECITSAEWPPRASDWSWRLKEAWDSTEVSGVHGADSYLFKRLEKTRYDLDRGRQRKLAELALKQVEKWSDRRDDASLWQSTLIDLHACTTDCLGMLLERLEKTVFAGKPVISGIQRAGRWPDRSRAPDKRKRDLREELAYCLIDNRTTNPIDVVDGLFELGAGTRVAYIEIEGPCDDEKDRPLVADMVAFWQEIIGAAAKRVPSLRYLPLLLVGHNDPEPPAGGAPAIDTTRFYHDDVLVEDHERRLGRIRGVDVHSWLDPIIPRSDLRRVDVERELARALGVQFIDDIDARMRQILTVVNRRTV